MTGRSLSIAQSSGRLILAAMVALVLVSSVLVPLTDTALAQLGANPVRSFLPDDQVVRGETFNVSVTFNVTTDNFNGILLRDNVPVDWTIQVNLSWCTPNADQANFSGNRSEYIWNGGSGVYSNGQGFTAVYQVTVPGNASPETYLFSGQLFYYDNSSGPYSEVIGGDSDVTVTVPQDSTPPTIGGRWGYQAPIIDGVFSDAEWTNPQLLIEDPIPTNVYFSNDDTFLYVCVDVADEAGGDYTPDENDHCLLMFDTNHDEVISEGREDLFHISANGFNWHNVAESDGVAYWVRHCDFDAHTGLEGVVGFGTSPNSPINHRIYEFQIPLSLLGASPGDTIGFASPIEPESIPYDYSRPIGFQHNIWPPDATASDMATWGDLVLASSSTAAIPTLSQWGMIGMAILFAAFLIWSLRRRRIVSADKNQ